MSENDINLGNLESINFLLLIPFITILYFIINSESDKKFILSLGVILSLLTSFLINLEDLLIILTKKDKVDYKN